MRLTLNEQDEAFRTEVRDFLRDHLPPDMAWRIRNGGFYGAYEDVMAWSRILGRRGWAVPHWPVEAGGTGWTPLQQHIFHEECKRAGAPSLPYQGPYLVGPVLLAVGSEAQKARFLPAIRSAETTWCQGFSEPGAGSDLASLRTTAVREGESYVVNGQKLWTSAAHIADWGFFLVRTRTDARPQESISFLLIDMKSPGITVRPVILLDGAHHVNEVFFNDARVPLDNLLGEENRGWTYAKTLLGAERTVSAEIYWSECELDKLKHIARHEQREGRPLIEDVAIRRRIASLEVEMLALRYSVLRVSSGARFRFHEGAVASALKVRGAELMQKVVEFQADLLGPKAMRFFHMAEQPDSPDDYSETPDWPAYVLSKSGGQLAIRAASIAGGAREIQKNIIARLAFGL